MTDGQKIRAFRRAHAQYEKRAARAFYLAIRAQLRAFVLSKSEDPDTISPEPITKAFRKVWRTIGVDYASKMHAQMVREEGGSASRESGKSASYAGLSTDGSAAIRFGELRKDADPYATEYVKLIDEYLKLHGAKKIVGITETTREWVREQLSSGHAQGLMYDQIAAAMVNDEINTSRAWLIARTESTGAMNFATFIAASKSNFMKEKNWIDSGDSRVRPDGNPHGRFDHHHEDIGKQPLDKPFFVSGEELMFPGDTSLGASAGNICNCRCSFGLKTLRDSSGRMIRKPIGYEPAMIQQLRLHSGVSGSLDSIVNGLMGIGSGALEAAAASLAGSVGDLISNLFNSDQS